MDQRSRRGKARKLQVLVAETLARRFNLTIEAEPPTKPGKRNKVRWVPETDNPDLRVRRMGEPGADVAMLTAKARVKLSLPMASTRGSHATILYRLPYFECKNTEAFHIGRRYWANGGCAAIKYAIVQATKRSAVGVHIPVAVLSSNRHPPVVFVHISWAEAIPKLMRVRPLLAVQESAIGIRLVDLMGLMKGR